MAETLFEGVLAAEPEGDSPSPEAAAGLAGQLAAILALRKKPTSVEEQEKVPLLEEHGRILDLKLDHLRCVARAGRDG